MTTWHRGGWAGAGPLDGPDDHSMILWFNSVTGACLSWWPVWSGPVQATSVLPTTVAPKGKYCWAEKALAELAPALWAARRGGFWVPPLLATATSLALLNSCAGREKPVPGWKRLCSVLMGKGRKKWTFLSKEVVPSLLWSYKRQAWFPNWEYS